MPRVEVKGEGNRAIFQVFKAYYSLRPELFLPEDFAMREFAFQPWGSPGYTRHISFRTIEEVYEYLQSKVPLHAYYSLARYELPEAPSMEEKGFLGADLMFDIDADHLEGCSTAIVGDECIRRAGRLIHRLARILKRDFSIRDYIIYFTGHRGFHLIARCEGCEGLGREERLEIAHYVAAEGLDLSLIFPSRPGEEAAVPSTDDPGWRGWIAEWLAFRGILNLGRGLREILGAEWRRRLQEAVAGQAVPIDMQVTQDTSRLVRIGGTLHGKTGLKVTVVEDPLRFKPTPALSPVRGEALVEAVEDVEVDSLLGSPISLRRGRRYRLEAPIGILLALKGMAKLLEVNGVVKVDTSRGSL
ncbi:MAG: hypothetical protein GSR80_001722 [Desulfurococcales archaeon]|nr:hypothetical protein [Desulfurococcales archaeon]